MLGQSVVVDSSLSQFLTVLFFPLPLLLFDFYHFDVIERVLVLIKNRLTVFASYETFFFLHS